MANKVSREKEAQAVAKALMGYVNSYSSDHAAFVDEVMRSHRTIQQALFGLMLQCMKRWTEDGEKGFFDLRNEYTVKMSKEIMKITEGSTYTPCI